MGAQPVACTTGSLYIRHAPFLSGSLAVLLLLLWTNVPNVQGASNYSVWMKHPIYQVCWGAKP